MEKEFEKHFNFSKNQAVSWDPIKPELQHFIHSYTRKLIESLAEEIIGSSYDWFAKWREYVNSKYDKKEAGVIDNYPYWLTEQQRLKVKEILSNLK